MKMHPILDHSRSTIPAFLNKLWKMVDDENTNDLICWSPGGDSFTIKHQGNFCNNLLPVFYKHSNMASFVRQLNIYDFHKVSNIESGMMKGDREEISFAHPYFKRDEPHLLEQIKRKIPAKPTVDANRQVEIMAQVLQDVEDMRNRQVSLNAQLSTMKQHNVALWRELSLLRRKHQKQQQIVNKLIQFLVSMVHNSSRNLGGLGVKRKYPLMINDIVQPKKGRRYSTADGPTIHELDEPVLEEGEVLPENDTPLIEIYSPDSQDFVDTDVEMLASNSSGSKKKSRNKSRKQQKNTIRKVRENIQKPPTLKVEIPKNETQTVFMSTPDAEVLKAAANEYGFLLTNENESLQTPIIDPEIINLTQIKREPPLSEPIPPIPMETIDPITDPIITDGLGFEDIIAEPGPSNQNTTIQSYNSNNQELDQHLDSMQSELESIKDMLSHEGYSIDANTLLGLFGCEDPMSYTLPMANNEPENVTEDLNGVDSLDPLIGNELMCAPNFDLDMYGTPPPSENNDLDRIDSILETLLATKDKK